MKKGQVYNYNEIETILNDTLDYVIEDLRKEQDKMDEIEKMLYELHTMMILILYKTALLKGVKNEDD